mmetsp:Transcript_22547/g.51416  ORF Transcript_22547/g.51416 Transcript_22547/m.51416 type:complete len:122 (+) Transcript_22547:202-567(+)
MPVIDTVAGQPSDRSTSAADELSDDILFGDMPAPRTLEPEVLDLLTQASDPTPLPKPKRRRILETPSSPCPPEARASEAAADASPPVAPKAAKASKKLAPKGKGKAKAQAKPVLRKVGKKL